MCSLQPVVQWEQVCVQYEVGTSDSPLRAGLCPICSVFGSACSPRCPIGAGLCSILCGHTSACCIRSQLGQVCVRYDVVFTQLVVQWGTGLFILKCV